MPIFLDFLQDREDRVVVRNALRVVIAAVRKALKLASRVPWRLGSAPGQFGRYHPLFRLRQTLHQLQDLKRDRAHDPKLSRTEDLGQSWDGGRERIRTSGRVTPTPDFESGAFNHSATLPAVDCQALTLAEAWQAASRRRQTLPEFRSKAS